MYSLRQALIGHTSGNLLATLHLSCDWRCHGYLLTGAFLLFRRDWRGHCNLLCMCAVSRHIVAKYEASYLSMCMPMSWAGLG